MIDEIEKTFDDELTARKITLSRETRRVCLSVLKHVLVNLAQAPTPVMGTPIEPLRSRAGPGVVIFGQKMFMKPGGKMPEFVNEIGGYTHDGRPCENRACTPTSVPEHWDKTEAVYPCRSRPQNEQCDRAGPGGFMGHTCGLNPHANYDPRRDV